MSEVIGIRSRKDLGFLLVLAGICIITISCMFLPHLLPFSVIRKAVLDISLLTYSITIFMTIISVVWAAYGVLGLLVKPQALRSSTFHGKFSIIVPAKDEESVIGNLLEDLHNQTYSNYETIVVCHNCSDNTFEKVKRFRDKRFKPLRLSGKPGKSVALNFGAERATGEVVVVFDADNRVPTDFLEKITHYFPGYDAVQSRIETGNSSFNLLTKLSELEFISFTDLFQRTRSAFRMNCALGGTGEVIKKEALQSVGWWDDWSLTEDFALFTKLTNKGFKIGWAYDTFVLDEKIPWWTEFFKQRARWMKGHYQVAVKYAKDYRKKLVDLHYLIAPISVAGYYFTFGLWLLFLLSLPISTSFLPLWFWVVPWVIWNVSIAIRIAVRKGVRSLLLFPLLYFYLYHWIAVFPYIFRTKLWTKTPHGFNPKRL